MIEGKTYQCNENVTFIVGLDFNVLNKVDCMTVTSFVCLFGEEGTLHRYLIPISVDTLHRLKCSLPTFS